MKIRKSFVSNSSSSSFILAYDESFFGDLEKFFRDYSPGCETRVREEDRIPVMLDEWYPEGKAKCEEAKAAGKKLLYISLDQEYFSIISLLKHINGKNGGDKLEIIYGDDEE